MGFIFVADTYFGAGESLWSNEAFSKEGTNQLGGQPNDSVAHRFFITGTYQTTLVMCHPGTLHQSSEKTL